MMEDTRRATIYFEAQLHQALRLKAAAANRSLSEMVNEAVRLSLAEDAEDLSAADQRLSEPSLDFASFVQELRQDGRL